MQACVQRQRGGVDPLVQGLRRGRLLRFPLADLQIAAAPLVKLALRGKVVYYLAKERCRRLELTPLQRLDSAFVATKGLPVRLLLGSYQGRPRRRSAPSGGSRGTPA